MRKLLVFRHGETDWNAEGRFQGHIDVPMNARGREQARALIEPLRAQGVELILSSDLSRAHETARIIAGELRIPVHADRRLREANLGEAQGLNREEIEARFGSELVARWKSTAMTDADVSYLGGETGAQVMERVFEALEEFVLGPQARGAGVIGVATHGGVIRRMMQKILPPDSGPVPIPNGVLYAVSFDRVTRKWSLTK